MIPVITSVFAVFNMFFVVFKQGGLNSVAVGVTALKEVLKDQEIAEGLTLYQAFDWIIDSTKLKG